MAIGTKLKELIDERIKNFLGYGDPDSPIWLIGMEEGVNGREKDTEDSNKDRLKKCDGKTFCDIKYAQDSCWKGNFYRLYELLLMLESDKNREAFVKDYKDSEEMKELVGQMGKLSKNGHSNCLFEFNPIPFRKPSNKKNASLSEKKGTFLWTNYICDLNKKNPRHNFLKGIYKDRISLIKTEILKNKPKIVIFYGLGYKWCHFKEGVWGDELEKTFEPENIGNYRNGDGANLYYSNMNYKKDNISYKTYIFIIPHCSAIPSPNYKLIGEKIKEIIK